MKVTAVALPAPFPPIKVEMVFETQESLDRFHTAVGESIGCEETNALWQAMKAAGAKLTALKVRR